VNAICPGYVDTEALEGMGEAETEASPRPDSMRRLGLPKKWPRPSVSGLHGSGYITGCALKVTANF